MAAENIQEILSALTEMRDDPTVPRNIKTKVSTILGIMGEDSDILIRVNKALNELDDISDDTNMQAYTRTQVWNIVSLLESIH